MVIVLTHEQFWRLQELDPAAPGWLPHLVEARYRDGKWTWASQGRRAQAKSPRE